MSEIISEIKTKDAETLRKEIMECTKTQIEDLEIEKLRSIRMKQLNKISKEIQKFRKNEAQKRYVDKNRELINERRKKSRLNDKKLLMVPDHIVKI